MKTLKLLTFLTAVLLFSSLSFAHGPGGGPIGGASGGGASANVEDDSYGAEWNGDTTNAPSQNALHDYLVNFDADLDGSFADEAWLLAQEAELVNSAGLAAALDDEVGSAGGGKAVFNIGAEFVEDGSGDAIIIGSAKIGQTELEILDDCNISTARLNMLAAIAGSTGTNTTNLVFSENPILTGNPDLADSTYDSLIGDAVAIPQVVLKDLNNPGTDKEIAKIYANFLSGADGAEDGSIFIQAMLGGTERTVFDWDSDTEALTLGDSATGEDLIFDFDTGTANEAKVNSNSGVTEIDISAINFVTTGSISGRPKLYSVSSNTTLSAEQMSGGIIIVTAAVEISLGDFCDSATGAMAMIVQADDSEKIEIGVTDTSDDMILDGTALGANQEIDSPGDATQDNFLVILCRETNEWHTYGRSGVWVDGGAAD